MLGRLDALEMCRGIAGSLRGSTPAGREPAVLKNVRMKSTVRLLLLDVSCSLFRSSRTANCEFTSTASCSRSPRRHAQGAHLCSRDLRMDTAAWGTVGAENDVFTVAS